MNEPFSPPPIVFRYEDQIYIDAFFKTGEIKIGCFHDYRKYEDNQLGDESEGRTFNYGQAKKSLGFGTVTTVGYESYSFCTSTLANKKLLEVFKRNSLFKIFDPENFVIEIAKALKIVNQYALGYCQYVDEKIINKIIRPFTMEDLKDEHGSISVNKMNEMNRQFNSFEQYFMKYDKYKEQSEFRMLWASDRIIKSYKIIFCPEAIKCCEKVDISNI